MIDFCGLTLEHEVINGSGTFDAIAARRVFGDALLADFPFSAFVSKTITLQPRDGNPPPRLYETPAGLINSIGLPNRGLSGYLEHDLPELARLPGAADHERHGLDRRRGVASSSRASPAATRSPGSSSTSRAPTCARGSTSAQTPMSSRACCTEVRPITAKPLIVKLTPNTADVARVAQAAEAAGADAVSLINTLRAYAPDPRAPGRPWLGGGTGGLSGPAIRAVALAQVAAVARARSGARRRHGRASRRVFTRARFLDAGATLVAVGTESFRDPLAGARIRSELAEVAANGGVLQI